MERTVGHDEGTQNVNDEGTFSKMSLRNSCKELEFQAIIYYSTLIIIIVNWTLTVRKKTPRTSLKQSFHGKERREKYFTKMWDINGY